MKKRANIIAVTILVFLLFACFAPLTGLAAPEKTFNKFTISWINWDGALLEQDTDVDCGTTPSYDGAEPVRTGAAQYDYTFSGWSPAVEAVTGDVVYTAQFTSVLKSYTVTFKDYNGAVLGTDTVDYGTGATAPELRKRAGYHFTGWDTGFSYVTGDLTVTARYALNAEKALLYTVTFADFSGGELGADIVPCGGNATPPADPSREGYKFTGWSTGYDNVTGDLTVYALYTVNTYAVTFVDYNGNVIKTQKVEWDTGAASPDAPARDGYTFTGWDVLFDNITKDTIVTAKYEAAAVTSPMSAAVIALEPIPQTGDVQGWMWWLLLIPGILILWLVIAVRLTVVPVAESLADNRNGTYTIQWGYDNRKHRRYTVGEDKSVFSVITGKLIKSSANPPTEFERGRAEGVFATIVDRNAEVQWKINNRKVKVDLKKLE